MPGALWEKAPQWLVKLDEQLQEKISASITPSAHPWKELRWLTESTEGLVLLIIVSFFAWSYYRNKQSALTLVGFKNFIRTSWVKIFALLIFAGLSDVLSNGLKRIVGRLKPHVTYYNIYFLPALSLPSNHAFNSSLLLSMVWQAVGPQVRHRERLLFRGLWALVFLIGFSRVLFGQHYPLDVLTGWFFGSLFGFGLSSFYQRIALGDKT